MPAAQADVPRVRTAPALAVPGCPEAGPLRREDSPGLSTEELVAAARRRDPEAWAELVARYTAMVRGVVVSFRLQEADALDAMQMTWLRAFERLDSLRSADRLGGWLATIANRECLALLRKARWETPDEAVAGEYPAGGLSPEAAVLVEEAKGAVRAAVAALPGRRQRLVHALFYRPERDYVSLADELGMPVGSIGPTRGRVLRALRGALEPAGFSAPSAVEFEADPPQHATAC